MSEARRNPRSPQFRGPVPDGELLGVELQPRVVPTSTWIERSRALQAADPLAPIAEPRDDERELAVFIRCNYVIPSQLVPQDQWPSVGMDVFEVGRISMVDLKKRVKATLASANNSLAEKITITEAPALT